MGRRRCHFRPLWNMAFFKHRLDFFSCFVCKDFFFIQHYSSRRELRPSPSLPLRNGFLNILRNTDPQFCGKISQIHLCVKKPVFFAYFENKYTHSGTDAIHNTTLVWWWLLLGNAELSSFFLSQKAKREFQNFLQLWTNRWIVQENDFMNDLSEISNHCFLMIFVLKGVTLKILM